MVANSRSDLNIQIKLRLYLDIQIYIGCASSEARFLLIAFQRIYAKEWFQIRALIYKIQIQIRNLSIQIYPYWMRKLGSDC